jgi:hypothetical protein
MCAELTTTLRLKMAGWASTDTGIWDINLADAKKTLRATFGSFLAVISAQLQRCYCWFYARMNGTGS